MVEPGVAEVIVLPGIEFNAEGGRQGLEPESASGLPEGGADGLKPENDAIGPAGIRAAEAQLKNGLEWLPEVNLCRAPDRARCEKLHGSKGITGPRRMESGTVDVKLGKADTGGQ